MNILLFQDEQSFLSNLLLDRRQSSQITSPSQTEIDTINGIILALIFRDNTGAHTFSEQQVGYLQYILQEQNEIWGSRHSTANEKSGTVGPGMNFVAHDTLLLVKSISDSLGAQLKVDINTKSDQNSPRGEGSTWIMTSLYPHEK